MDLFLKNWNWNKNFHISSFILILGKTLQRQQYECTSYRTPVVQTQAILCHSI